MVPAYALGRSFKTEHTVLVFDLGSGGLNVSLVQIDEGCIEVKATAGNTHLGGNDFDTRMVEYYVQQFREKYHKDISNDTRALCRLRFACESAKRTLSVAAQTVISIDSFLDGTPFNETITRSQFEELNNGLFRSTLDSVEKVLRGAKCDKAKVNEVILVGGSTRIPKVQQLLVEYFNGKTLNKSINPDEAVACGAAVQATILTGEHSKGLLKDVILVDITPFSLGMETAGQQMHVLIPRYTTTPCKKSQTFSTYFDNQTRFSVHVFEGERARSKDNTLLACFELSDIAPAPRGVPKIEVTFDLEVNDILNVSAEDKSTGKKVRVACKRTRDCLSESEVNRMVMEAAQRRRSNEAIRKRLNARNDLDGYICLLRNALKEFERSVTETSEWLTQNTDAQEDEYTAQRKRLEEQAQRIFQQR